MNKGDEAFEMWKAPEAEVYLKVFIFNITNRDDYLSGKDEKLKFQEVGPYVYRYVVYWINKNKKLKNIEKTEFATNTCLGSQPQLGFDWNSTKLMC